MFTKQEIKDRLTEIFNTTGAAVPAGYNLACLIADSALFYKKDKGGNDYAHHTTAVSFHDGLTETQKIIGKLHDLIEDSDWTLDDLREVGFSEEVVNGVDAITRRERQGEAYFDFIARCGRNRDAREVKLADLQHNLTLTRNHFLPHKNDTLRWSKYLISYNYLTDVRQEKVPPGTGIAEWMRHQKPELQNWDLVRRHSNTLPDWLPLQPDEGPSPEFK